MFTHLSIQNLAVVKSLDVDMTAGLTAITGETGAGKSIMLDALSLALGERTDSSKIRAGASRCDIHASFDITRLGFVKSWLKIHDIEGDDGECI